MQRMILVPGANCPNDVPDILHFSANPSDIETRHEAGLAHRPAPLFPDLNDPLPALGYGGPPTTVLSMNILLEGHRQALPSGEPGPVEDVRRQTHWLYRLAQQPGPGLVRPCEVDIIWGRNWAFRGTIRQLAERLDQFTPDGTAVRAWVRVELAGKPLTVQAPAAMAEAEP